MLIYANLKNKKNLTPIFRREKFVPKNDQKAFTIDVDVAQCNAIITKHCQCDGNTVNFKFK